MLEFEHQAEHWDTPDHGDTGHLIASALRAAVDIARSGGLRCEHRRDSLATLAEPTLTQTAGVRRRRDAA